MLGLDYKKKSTKCDSLHCGLIIIIITVWCQLHSEPAKLAAPGSDSIRHVWWVDPVSQQYRNSSKANNLIRLRCQHRRFLTALWSSSQVTHRFPVMTLGKCQSKSKVTASEKQKKSQKLSFCCYWRYSICIYNNNNILFPDMSWPIYRQSLIYTLYVLLKVIDAPTYICIQYACLSK